MKFLLITARVNLEGSGPEGRVSVDVGGCFGEWIQPQQRLGFVLATNSSKRLAGNSSPNVQASDDCYPQDLAAMAYVVCFERELDWMEMPSRGELHSMVKVSGQNQDKICFPFRQFAAPFQRIRFLPQLEPGRNAERTQSARPETR